MKRFSLIVSLLLGLSVLYAQTGLLVELSVGDQSSRLGPLTQRAVQNAVEHYLLYRGQDQDILEVQIGPIEETGPFAISTELVFSSQEKHLVQILSASGKHAEALEKELETSLFEQLFYDGLILFPPHPSTYLEYAYGQGYTTSLEETKIQKGDVFSVVTAQGDQVGTLVAHDVLALEKPVVLFAQIGGKQLIPGLEISEKQGNQASVSFSLGRDLTLGFEGAYTQDIGLYPFLLTLNAGTSFSSGTFRDVRAGAGLEVRLPLSLLFGTRHGFWRNSSVGVTSRVGMGVALSSFDLVFGSDTFLSYRYQLGGWSLQLNGGNKYWVSSTANHASGLFLALTTAYTY